MGDSVKDADRPAEVAGEGSLAAFNFLVAAASADANLEGEHHAEELEHTQRQLLCEDRLEHPSGTLNPASADGEMSAAGWRVTFGGVSIASEMTAAKSKADDPQEVTMGKLDVPGVQNEVKSRSGRGSRRRGATRHGSCSVSQAAINRRKVKDLELGDDVTGPGGFAEAPGKKRGSKEVVQWNKDDAGMGVKRQAVVLCQGQVSSKQGDGSSLSAERGGSRKSSTQDLPRKRLRPQRHYALCSAVDESTAGMRRRGRPPGSGNRKPMEPQRTRPDGTKHFNLRSPRFTGVYRTPAGRWRAQFCHRGQVVQLGMYDSESAAARRWDMEAVRLRGDRTQLNFPGLKSAYLSHLEEAEKLDLGYDIEVPESIAAGEDVKDDGAQLGTYDNENAANHHCDMEVVRHEANEAQITFPSLKPTYAKQNEDTANSDIDFDIKLPDDMAPLEGNYDEDSGITTTIDDLYGAFALPSSPHQLDPAGAHEDIWGEPSTIDPFPAPFPVLPGVPQDLMLDDALQASLEETLADPWGMLSVVAPAEGSGGKKVVPDSVLIQMRTTLEGIVKAADKDIEMMRSRLLYASQIVQYGESMTMDAQMCKTLCSARQQAASKLLEKFEGVWSCGDGQQTPEEKG